MKNFPTFEELGKHTYGWETCFDTNQRYRYLYVGDTRVAEVYENGRVVIITTFRYTPDVRKAVYAKYALDIRLLREAIGYEFYTTDGRKVHRIDIDTRDAPVLLDHEFGVLKVPGFYMFRAKSSPLTYVHPNAQPSGGKEFRVGTVDNDKVKLAMKLVKPYAMLGSTVHSLSDSRERVLVVSGAHDFINNLISGSGPTLEDTPAHILAYYGRAQLNGYLRSAVYDACKEFTYVDTLLFKPR